MLIKLLSQDQIPQDLTSGVVYKFQCRLSNKIYCGEYVRHLDVKIGEDISISPLTRKQVKPKNSSIVDHLLFCNHSASYNNFSILTLEKKYFLLELEEHLLMMRVKTSLNRNSTSAPLLLFDRPRNKILECYLFSKVTSAKKLFFVIK